MALFHRVSYEYGLDGVGVGDALVNVRTYVARRDESARRQLRAWNNANRDFWRSGGILDRAIDLHQPFDVNNDRLSSACWSWFFLTNNAYQGPTAVAHGK